MLTMHCILCIVAMYKFRINTAQVLSPSLTFEAFVVWNIGTNSHSDSRLSRCDRVKMWGDSSKLVKPGLGTTGERDTSSKFVIDS